MEKVTIATAVRMGGDTTDIQELRTPDAVKHPTIHRTTIPHPAKNFPVQKVIIWQLRNPPLELETVVVKTSISRSLASTHKSAVNWLNDDVQIF
jgi:hypothetical protein